MQQEPNLKEVFAAISYALHEELGKHLHDQESYVLTIKRGVVPPHGALRAKRCVSSLPDSSIPIANQTLTHMKEYKYKINGNEYSVAIIDLEGNTAAVEVNGVSYKVDILTEGFTAAPARPAAKPLHPPLLLPPHPQLLSPQLHSLSPPQLPPQQSLHLQVRYGRTVTAARCHPRHQGRCR